MNQDDPKTWKVGDVIKNVKYGALIEFLAHEPSEGHGCFFGITIEDCDSAIGRLKKGAHWDGSYTKAEYTLVRRANAEGSGECQSEPVSKADELPVIEQKPVCMCCTIQAGTSEDLEPIRHEDPCRFTLLERYMLPIAKAQFRERQKELKERAFWNYAIAKEAERLKASECSIYRGKLPVHDIVPANAAEYSRLTGHNFKDD